MSSPWNKATFIVEASDDNSSDAFTSSVDRMIEGVKDSGHNLALARRINNKVELLPGYSVDEMAPNVAWGSIQFIKNLQIPHYAYGWDNTHWSDLTSRFHRDIMLNKSHVLTTIGDLILNMSYFQHKLYGRYISYKPVFIRPVSNRKEFAGQVFNTHEDFIILVEQLNLPKETVCVIDVVHDIDAEFRCFVVDRRVELVVQYANKNYDKSINGREIALNDIVEGWAKYTSFIDDCFVIDVALHENSIRLLELNSFCCSGFYDANISNLVDAVARVAIDKF